MRGSKFFFFRKEGPNDIFVCRWFGATFVILNELNFLLGGVQGFVLQKNLRPNFINRQLYNQWFILMGGKYIIMGINIFVNKWFYNNFVLWRSFYESVNIYDCVVSSGFCKYCSPDPPVPHPHPHPRSPIRNLRYGSSAYRANVEFIVT